MLRFAPSPTGFLHVGNARIALLNFLFAKKEKMKFLLRIDDTDSERSKEHFVKEIKKDLSWLGIKYDLCFNQSGRLNKYYDESERLKKKGKIYACYESLHELELKRKIQLKTGKPPIYDRESLRLTQKQISDFKFEGRKPYWRLFLDDDSIEWNDSIHDKIKFEKLSISDPVLIRSDETPLFTLTSVIDDADFKISHIIRGDDHITNTAAQIKLFQYLDSKIPKFAHFPLMQSSSGESLSKRDNSFSLKEIRNKGINPNVVNTILVKLGSSVSIESIKDINSLVNEFNMNYFSKNNIRFNFGDLFRLNAKDLKNITFEEIQKKYKKNISKDFWNAIKQNVDSLEDIDEWVKIIYNNDFNQKYTKDKTKMVQIAFNILPKNIDKKTWNLWTKKISKLSGIKGKDLFLTLRSLITGKEKGPEMNLLLPLIDREEILRRLKN